MVRFPPKNRTIRFAPRKSFINTKAKNNSETKSLKTKRPETSPKHLKPCSVAQKFIADAFSQFCARNFKHDFKASFHSENLQVWPR